MSRRKNMLRRIFGNPLPPPNLRAAPQRRVFNRLATGSAGVFCTQHCLPGCCFNESGGQICCVTGGNRSLCVADCFAYEWPGQHAPDDVGALALNYGKVRTSNPTFPGGVSVPTAAWIQSHCAVTDHDYGNGNVQHIYTCEFLDPSHRRWRCTWQQWNDGALAFQDCTEITRPHYYQPGIGPGSYAPAQPYELGPRAPVLDQAALQLQRYRRAA